MTFTATYDGRTLTPSEPLGLPIGTPVTLTVADADVPPPDSPLYLLHEMQKFPVDENWPADGAATCKPHHRRHQPEGP
jgi:hypothetical protein